MADAFAAAATRADAIEEGERQWAAKKAAGVYSADSDADPEPSGLQYVLGVFLAIGAVGLLAAYAWPALADMWAYSVGACSEYVNANDNSASAERVVESCMDRDSWHAQPLTRRNERGPSRSARTTRITSPFNRSRDAASSGCWGETSSESGNSVGSRARATEFSGGSRCS